MSKNVVFIVNLPESKKPGRNTPFYLSIKKWTGWCKKYGHELFVLTERIYDEQQMNANWHKIFVFQLLEANEIDYNQILIVDADTMPTTSCPDIFKLTDEKMCVVQNYGVWDWVYRSIEIYKEKFFPNIDIKLSEYFNSGVLVLNKKHKSLFDKTLEFYLENQKSLVETQGTEKVGTDQPILNFLVKQENIDIKMLPYEWNAQSLFMGELVGDDNGNIILQHLPKLNILHFNGWSDKQRLHFMTRVYDVEQW